jgi:uncharacterized SAM-binding protein YcdF (DUF218 family)
MPPLATRLALSRFLDPAVLLVVALGVAIYAVLRDGPARGATGRRARVALVVAWATLWALSTPVVSEALLASLEISGPDPAVALAGKDPASSALVVLGGGVRTIVEVATPRERLSAASAQRTLTAARLWQSGRFAWVVVSSLPIETEGMEDLLIALGVPRASVIREDRALDTRDNAVYSAGILREKRVENVFVVTTASHLRRSLREFASAGVRAFPAPAEVSGRSPVTIDAFLPSSMALLRTHTALHEILGALRP